MSGSDGLEFNSKFQAQSYRYQVQHANICSREHASGKGTMPALLAPSYSTAGQSSSFREAAAVAKLLLHMTVPFSPVGVTPILWGESCIICVAPTPDYPDMFWLHMLHWAAVLVR